MIDELYRYVIVGFQSAPFPRLPAAVLAIADSGPVGKEGALPTMVARHAVLPTRSVSSRPTHLRTSSQNAHESPQIPFFIFKRLRTLSFSVSSKSFACHSYENSRVCTNNSQTGTRYSPITTVLKVFLFTLSRTLLRFLAFSEKSTPFFSGDSALFAQNMGGGVRG